MMWNIGQRVLIGGQGSFHQRRNIFDESFEEWKNRRLERCVYDFAEEWGLDGRLLRESVASYSYSQPTVVPYIDELTKSIVFENAANRTAGNKLRHIMA